MRSGGRLAHPPAIRERKPTRYTGRTEDTTHTHKGPSLESQPAKACGVAILAKYHVSRTEPTLPNTAAMCQFIEVAER